MSNPIERAEQAVAEAREAVLLRLAGGLGRLDLARDERLVDDLIRAVRHLDAEMGRALSRDGYSAREIANKIDPEVDL